MPSPVKQKKTERTQRKMRRIALMIIALALLATPAVPSIASAGNSAGASVDVMSQYVWRGIAFSNGVVMQPSVDFSLGALNVNMWSNIDMDPIGTEETSAYNETDLTIGYALPFEAVDMSAGYIYYSLGDPALDTQEVYLTMGKELGPVTPYLNIYWDVDEGSGIYAQLGAVYAVELSEKASLSVGAYISYVVDNKVMLVDVNGQETSDLYNAELSVGLEYAVSDTLSISPMLSYTTSMSDDAEASIKGMSHDGDTDSVTYGGVSLALGF